MTITLNDITCLLHLPIRGTFLDHEKIDKEEALNMLVEKLGVTPQSALGEIDKTCGCHVRYNYLANVFTDEIRRARKADANPESVNIIIDITIKSHVVKFMSEFPGITSGFKDYKYIRIVHPRYIFCKLEQTPYSCASTIRDENFALVQDHESHLMFETIPCYCNGVSSTNTIYATSSCGNFLFSSELHSLIDSSSCLLVFRHSSTTSFFAVYSASSASFASPRRILLGLSSSAGTYTMVSASNLNSDPGALSSFRPSLSRLWLHLEFGQTHFTLASAQNA